MNLRKIFCFQKKKDGMNLIFSDFFDSLFKMPHSLQNVFFLKAISENYFLIKKWLSGFLGFYFRQNNIIYINIDFPEFWFGVF